MKHGFTWVEVSLTSPLGDKSIFACSRETFLSVHCAQNDGRDASDDNDGGDHGDDCGDWKREREGE